MILLEIPFHTSPSISIDDVDCIYVIGDSVSVGMGKEGEQAWPVLLEQQLGIKTINLAKAGATVESALKQASHVSDKNSIVILEIGGNDLLGNTPLDTFASSCGELLEKIGSYKQIIWLELPSLPQYYSYGRIQRKLAKEYNVTLVPKSVFARVFSRKGATSDGIHLTQKGHEFMAAELQKLFERDEDVE
jgi:acyl-CoA thioesterase-1